MVRSCSGNIFHKFIDLINAFRSIHTESFGIQASVFIDLNNNFFFSSIILPSPAQVELASLCALP